MLGRGSLGVSTNSCSAWSVPNVPTCCGTPCSSAGLLVGATNSPSQRYAGSVPGPPQALLGVRFKASETFPLLALDI